MSCIVAVVTLFSPSLPLNRSPQFSFPFASPLSVDVVLLLHHPSSYHRCPPPSPSLSPLSPPSSSFPFPSPLSLLLSSSSFHFASPVDTVLLFLFPHPSSCRRCPPPSPSPSPLLVVSVLLLPLHLPFSMFLSSSFHFASPVDTVLLLPLPLSPYSYLPPSTSPSLLTPSSSFPFPTPLPVTTILSFPIPLASSNRRRRASYPYPLPTLTPCARGRKPSWPLFPAGRRPSPLPLTPPSTNHGPSHCLNRRALDLDHWIFSTFFVASLDVALGGGDPLDLHSPPVAAPLHYIHLLLHLRPPPSFPPSLH